MEMEAEHYVLAMTTVGDTQEGLRRLCEAVEEIDRREEVKLAEFKQNGDSLSKQKSICNSIQYPRMKQRMTISRAMDAQSTECPLEQCEGKISAEFVYLYPPGIPILAPGEQITGHFPKNVRRYMEQGLELQGLCDYTNKTIRIVKE
jgi:arginine/lysine/ornithine decarboxylase